MADPVTLTMAGISAAGSAAGGILGAVGAQAQGEAQAAMYRYKSGIALMNQKINLQNATFAEQEGEISAEEKGLAGAQQIADTKVIQAASGFDVNTGTGEVVRRSQVSASGFDQSIIRWDAAKKAYGYGVKAAEDEAESNLDTAAAGFAKRAGDIGALSSILGGVTGVASKWTQGKSIGLFNTS